MYHRERGLDHVGIGQRAHMLHYVGLEILFVDRIDESLPMLLEILERTRDHHRAIALRLNLLHHQI